MAHASIAGARSRAAFAEIARHVAGGESSYARLRAGQELVIEHAAGPRIRDADGTEYLDYCMGYGVNLFGHAPAFVWEAVQETVEQLGLHIAFPHRLAGEVAELVAGLVPGVEQLRFAELGHRGDPGGRPARPRRDRTRSRAQVRGALPRLGRSRRGGQRPGLRGTPRPARFRGNPALGHGEPLDGALERRERARRGARGGRRPCRRRDLRGRARLRRRARAPAGLPPAPVPLGALPRRARRVRRGDDGLPARSRRRAGALRRRSRRHRRSGRSSAAACPSQPSAARAS